jgi:REP element-mobilizing transposase RayT
MPVVRHAAQPHDLAAGLPAETQPTVKTYRCPIHLIWTTYMTWPPGDPRGHWSPLFNFYGHLIDGGHKLNLPDPITCAVAAGVAKEPRKVLTIAEQQIVTDTIGEVLRTQMEPGAQIHAGAIEDNHVHLLLGPVNEPIDRVVGRLKGRTSSAVLAEGSEPGRQRTWTAGYWKVFLFDLVAVPLVIDYIEQHNVRRGLPAAPYDWITPIC